VLATNVLGDIHRLAPCDAGSGVAFGRPVSLGGAGVITGAGVESAIGVGIGVGFGEVEDKVVMLIGSEGSLRINALSCA